ncbi:MAG TPA: hypothetical protein VEV41_24925 [Terriglobales bacterium]|jgi:hypothetical protein|nr:hypothetical protein [Terriglobales bacterium]
MKSSKKSAAAALLGRLGGKARAKNLSPERLSTIGKLGVTNRNQKLSAADRKRIAKLAAEARWRKKG